MTPSAHTGAGYSGYTKTSWRTEVSRITFLASYVAVAPENSTTSLYSPTAGSRGATSTWTLRYTATFAPTRASPDSLDPTHPGPTTSRGHASQHCRSAARPPAPQDSRMSPT